MASNVLIDAAHANGQIVNDGFELFSIKINVELHAVNQGMPTSDKMFHPLQKVYLPMTVRSF